jgi:hypothetical protein
VARRRRRTVFGVLAGAVLVVLWALLGGPGVPADGAAAPGGAAPVGGAAEPGPKAEARARSLAETDELEGCLHQVRQAAEDGRLGAAWAALDAARALAIETPALSDSREAASRALQRAVDDGVRALAQRVIDGQVAQAKDQLARLRDPPHPVVERALQAAVEARGLAQLAPPEPAAPPPEAAAPPPEVPAPAALPRGRLVRVPFQGAWTTGRVLSSSSAAAGREEVAVEVTTARGPAYPFVARAALEPTAPSPAEAADQGLAALREGDAVLAALWLAHCRAAGAADAERVRVLARALGR